MENAVWIVFEIVSAILCFVLLRFMMKLEPIRRKFDVWICPLEGAKFFQVKFVPSFRFCE